MKRILLVLISGLALVVSALAQDATPTPAPSPIPKIDLIEEQNALLQKQTALLKAQIEYLKAYSEASGNSSVTRDTSGGKTTFAVEDKPIFETIDLSYEAISEVAGNVSDRIKPYTSGYDRIVVYYEPDFLALSRYRMYRQEAANALENYERLIKAVEEEAKRIDSDKAFQIESADGGGRSPLISALAAPGIIGSAVKSVAELISLFRTDRTITQSAVVIDQRTVNTVMSGVLLTNSKAKVYNPAQFVPEYDIGTGDPNSFYQTLSRLRAAAGYVNYLLEAAEHMPPKQKNAESFARLLASIRIVKRQLDLLSFSIEPDPIPETDAERAVYTEFRSMVRAEKLDQFIRGGTNVGILKLKVLSSGGSRRESRNLLLGTRNDYSGSAIVEVALYDLDGTMRVADVFRHHTGFRKYKVKKVSPTP